MVRWPPAAWSWCGSRTGWPPSFLHIQGSGRIELDDGTLMRVGYGGQNGHAYVAIGRELIARGALTPKSVSLQSIRAWLRAHPDEAAALMAKNPSYVFFRRIEGEGPVGAEGTVLTAGRSLAVDRRYLPLGVPLWLDAQAPPPSGSGRDRPLRRVVIAQDTGGAIPRAGARRCVLGTRRRGRGGGRAHETPGPLLHPAPARRRRGRDVGGALADDPYRPTPVAGLLESRVDGRLGFLDLARILVVKREDAREFDGAQALR